MTLSPHLTHLTLVSDEDSVHDPEVLATIMRLPKHCPEHPQILTSGVSEIFNETMAKLYPRLENLNTLMISLTSISAEDLVSLAGSPYLQSLSVTVSGRNDPCNTFSGRPVTARSFDALTRLDIRLHRYKHATRLLNYVNSSNLAAFSLHTQRLPSMQQVEALIEALTAVTAPRTRQPLREFRFSTNPDYPNSSIKDRLIALATLRPLLGLPIEVLEMDGFFVDLDDDDLGAMATAWPMMERLQLATSVGWGRNHPPRATILALLPFFQRCQNIKKIGIRMRTEILSSSPRLHIRPGNGIMTANGHFPGFRGLTHIRYHRSSFLPLGRLSTRQIYTTSVEKPGDDNSRRR